MTRTYISSKHNRTWEIDPPRLNIIMVIEKFMIFQKSGAGIGYRLVDRVYLSGNRHYRVD